MSRRRTQTTAAPALALALALVAGTALAQPASLNMGGDRPIEVVAEGGLEFHDKERVAIARGGAVASQGDLTVKADTLAAFFRKTADGGNEIYRLTAEGGVEIRTPTQTAVGDRGVYDVDRQVAVLTGDDLRLTTEEDTVTARESLEYWRTQNLAVARGDAVATRGDNKVRADRLVGLLQDADGALDLTRIDAEGGVVITTPKEVARGERGSYDIGSRKAVLTGNVRVTRGDNQLIGGAAEVDLETGISRLLAGPQAEAEKTRVRGLFIPAPRPAGETGGTGNPTSSAPAKTPGQEG